MNDYDSNNNGKTDFWYANTHEAFKLILPGTGTYSRTNFHNNKISLSKRELLQLKQNRIK